MCRLEVKQKTEINNQCTQHALKRMSQRGITPETIQITLHYGRMIYAGGCRCYVIGRKELEHFARQGIQLTKAEGIHVLVASRNSNQQILTVYRNRNLSSIKSMIKRRR